MVRWKGYGEADATWEPRANLEGGCDELLREFHAQGALDTAHASAVREEAAEARTLPGHFRGGSEEAMDLDAGAPMEGAEEEAVDAAVDEEPIVPTQLEVIVATQSMAVADEEQPAAQDDASEAAADAAPQEDEEAEELAGAPGLADVSPRRLPELTRPPVRPEAARPTAAVEVEYAPKPSRSCSTRLVLMSLSGSSLLAPKMKVLRAPAVRGLGSVRSRCEMYGRHSEIMA